MIVFNLNPHQSSKNFIYFPSELSLIREINGFNIYFSSLECKMVISHKEEGVEKEIINAKPLNYSDILTPKYVLSIFMTTKCNLNCNYCYAKGQQTIYYHQNFESVKTFLETFIKKRSKKIDRVRFQGGGEPTLEINLIEKIINYAKNKFNIKKFEIQSNLLFDDKVAKFIGQNFTYVYASIDGPEDIQFKNRGVTPNQNKIIEKNLKYLLTTVPHFVIRSTITKYSCEKMEEIVDYFINVGVKNAVFEPVFKMGKAKYSSNEYNTPPSFNSFLSKFVEIKKYAEKKYLFIFSCFLPLEYSGLYYCGGSSCYSICLTTDNFISTCDEHFLGQQDDSPFIIGRFDKLRKKIIYNRNNIKLLKNRNVVNLNSCKNCFLRWSCRGQCPSRTLDNTGDIYKPDQSKCKWIKKYSKEYLLYKAKQILKENDYI